MPAQKREPARNYIGLVADDAEERHAHDSTSDRRMQDYLLGLMAAIFRRRAGAG